MEWIISLIILAVIFIAVILTMRKLVNDIVTKSATEVVSSLNEDSSVLSTTLDVLWQTNASPLFKTDINMVVENVNQSYLDFFDLDTEEEAKSGLWLSRLTPEGKELAMKRMEIIKRKIEPFSYDNWLADGTMIRFVGYPTHDVLGNFDGYTGTILIPKNAGIVKDVIEIKKMIESLKDAVDEHVKWEMDVKFEQDTAAAIVKDFVRNKISDDSSTK